jgi:D-alanyl-D-alanine carboxypeptidase
VAAEKRYKLTAAVLASPEYAGRGNKYGFKVGYQKPNVPETVVIPAKNGPMVDNITGASVLGTTNDWAQIFMDNQIIPKGLYVNGQPYFGTPGQPVWETTTDPVTVDLDAIFDAQ